MNKGEEIEMVDQFVYLGGMLTTGGEALQTAEYRLGIARAMFNKLGNVWCSTDLNHKIKVELYKVAIVSTATYGCEVWKFDTQTRTRMNNFNAKCLAMITGNTIHEMSKSNKYYNLVVEMKVKRVKRIQKILCMGESREPVAVLEEVFKLPRHDGCTMEDIPEEQDFDTLKSRALDNAYWRCIIKKLRQRE